MRKTTKKVVSFVLATTMAFSTFVAQTAFVSAATTGTFDATALALPAADEELMKATEVSAPFGISGDVKKRVSFTDSSKTEIKAVTSVEVAKNNGSAITVTVDAGDTITALMSSTGGSNKSAIGIADSNGIVLAQGTSTGTASGAESISYTATTAGTYRVMSPEFKDDAGKERGARVYTITVTPGSGSTTPTTPEQTTTAPEQSTQATTTAPEQSTQGTTTAPAAAATPNITVPATAAVGDKITVSDGITFTALQSCTKSTWGTPAAAEAGITYSDTLKSDGANNASINGKNNVRVIGVISATKDADVTISVKVGSNKQAYAYVSDTELPVLGDDSAPVEFDVANATVLPEGFHDTTVSVKAGKYVYLMGVGTNLEVADLYVAGAAPITPPEQSTEATTEDSTAAEPVASGSALYPNVAAIKGGALGIIAEPALKEGVVKEAKVKTTDGVVDGYEIVGKEGDTFDVNLMLYNNKADANGNTLGTITFLFEYDPEIVIAQEVNYLEPTDDVVLYEYTQKGQTQKGVWFDEEMVPAMLTNVPEGGGKSNDFWDRADGVKTAAQLGRLVMGNYRQSPTGTAPTLPADKAIMVSLKMKIVKQGATYFTIEGKIDNDHERVPNVPTSAPDVQEMGECLRSTNFIKIVDAVVTTTEATTATTTEATTQATTAATTEATTEATTQATTAVDNTTEATTKKKTSSGGGGGGGSSSSKASGKDKKDTNDKIAPTKIPGKPTGTPTTPISRPTVVSAPSFVAPNGTVITAPALADSEGNVYAGSNIPSRLLGSNTFNDTSVRAWAVPSIEKLAALGIINGVGNGKFAPDANCKRADFIVMLVKTLGLTGTATDNFDDVVPGKYYTNAVGLAKEAGIATGYGDGNFGPENTITRQDMMVLVAKTMEFLGADITADTAVLDRFADASQMGGYARPYAAYLVSNGMVSGTGANIEPTALMTRAQLAVLVEKLYDKVIELAPAIEEEVEEAVEETAEEAEAEEESAEEESSEETTEETEEATEEATAE